MITWNTDVNAPCCPGEIVADNGRRVLVQTDWDFPGTATTFGWDISAVRPKIGTAYFYRFVLELPIEAVDDCSHSGGCDADVEYWAGEIDRPDIIAPELLAAELRDYGAWDGEELADDAANWRRIIWIAAGDIRENRCTHDRTDGTIDCPNCGVTAGEFIDSARQWLEDNSGATADDPGYFDNAE